MDTLGSHPTIFAFEKTTGRVSEDSFVKASSSGSLLSLIILWNFQLVCEIFCQIDLSNSVIKLSFSFSLQDYLEAPNQND